MEYKFKFVLENDKGEKVITESYTLDIIMFCDMLDRIHEDLNEKYGCDGNCTNESNSFCECGGIFDDYEITDKLMWTGLKDKNEADVYEGDWLVNQYKAYRLVKRTKYGEYRLFCGKSSSHFVNGWKKGIEWELTDNPELLKE